MVHRFPRYLRGYVEFEIRGNGIEDFLTSCTKNNIHLFDTHFYGETLYAKCFVSDYKKFIDIPLSGLRRKIIKRKGIRFKTHKYRKRIGLLAGAFIMVFALIYLSGFVWEIEIIGNNRISDNLLIQTLEECGFYEGVNKKSIKISEIENKMMQELCDLSRIAINLDGSIAHIEVTEREMPPVMEDFSQPSNLIAAHDGQILKMEIVKGKPIASVGSGVVKGEILVSGHYLDKKENEIIEHSSGKVTALVEISKTFKVPMQKEVKKRVEDRKTLSVILLNKEFELGKKNNVEHYKVKKKYSLSFLGLDLPIIIAKNTYYREETDTRTLSKEEAKDEILMAIEHFEKNDLFGSVIKEKDIVWSENSSFCKATVDFTVVMDIAEQNYIDSNQKIL